MSMKSIAQSLGNDVIETMASLDQLTDMLLVYTPESGMERMNRVSSIIPYLVACVSRFMAGWAVEGDEEEYGDIAGTLEDSVDESGLSGVVVERALNALSRAASLDPGSSRDTLSCLACPASLATLRRLLRAAACGAGMIESETVETAVLLLCRISSGHTHSVLRSGCIESALRLLSASTPAQPSLSAHAKSCVVDLATAAAEAASTREDAALMLEMCPLLLEVAARAYPSPALCVHTGGRWGREVVVRSHAAPSASAGHAMTAALRALARFTSNQAHTAHGHWQQWAAEYGFEVGDGEELDDDEEEEVYAGVGRPQEGDAMGPSDGIPANWAYVVIVHLVRMGILRLWATALAGHGAAMTAAEGGGVYFAPSSSGVLLTRPALRAILRACVRTLLVLRTADRLPLPTAVQDTPSTVTGGYGMVSSVPRYTACVTELCDRSGLLISLTALLHTIQGNGVGVGADVQLQMAHAADCPDGVCAGDILLLTRCLLLASYPQPQPQ